MVQLANPSGKLKRSTRQGFIQLRVRKKRAEKVPDHFKKWYWPARLVPKNIPRINSEHFDPINVDAVLKGLREGGGDIRAM